jgi:hypothetical protein
MRGSSVAGSAAKQILGAATLHSLAFRGFIEIVARNGHTYHVFKPVIAREVGDHQRGTMSLTWCVFGIDPRYGTDPEYPGPREHFFSFRSMGAAHYKPAALNPILHEELVSIWYALKDDPPPFLSQSCDPLQLVHRYKCSGISRMLRKIGRDLGPDEYRTAWDAWWAANAKPQGPLGILAVPKRSPHPFSGCAQKANEQGLTGATTPR